VHWPSIAGGNRFAQSFLGRLPVPVPVGPVPGWHAIDVQWILSRQQEFRYFLRFTPVATVGYSIYIYNITWDEANAVRRSLGLAPFDIVDEMASRFVRRPTVDASDDRQPRVAIYARRSADEALVMSDEVSESLEGLNWKPVDAIAIKDGALKNFDVVVFPGGKAHEQAADLGSLGRMKVREFVKDGGGYLGICAGAFLGSSTFDWSLSLVNAETRTGTHYVPKIGDQMWLNRGAGDVQSQLSESGLAVFGGGRSLFQAIYTGGPIFQPGRRTDIGEYVILARYTSEVYLFEFQRNTMSGTPAVIAAPYGNGKVILIGPHFESVSGSKEVVSRTLKAVAKVERPESRIRTAGGAATSKHVREKQKAAEPVSG